MPKLAAKDRKKVANAEPLKGFEPLPPGKYIATLEEVEAKQSSAGNPMWKCTFKDIDNLDGERQPGHLWYNLNLSTTDTPPEDYGKTAEKWVQYQRLCDGRMAAFFDAFGYDPSSDTDEFIGERCVLQVGVGTINKGPRTGETTNQVNGVAALDSVEFTEGEGASASDPDEF